MSEKSGKANSQKLWEGLKIYTTTLECNVITSHEFEYVPPYDQAISLLGLYPGEILGHGKIRHGQEFYHNVVASVKT